MTEEQLDWQAWLLAMAIGTPIILLLHWVGILPICV